MDMWPMAISLLGMVADLSTQWPAPTFPGLPAPKPPRAEDLPKLAAALRLGLQMPQTTLTSSRWPRLGWGCDPTNGPCNGACSEIPASQPSMARGLEAVSDTGSYPWLRTSANEMHFG